MPEVLAPPPLERLRAGQRQPGFLARSVYVAAGLA